MRKTRQSQALGYKRHRLATYYVFWLGFRTTPRKRYRSPVWRETYPKERLFALTAVWAAAAKDGFTQSHPHWLRKKAEILPYHLTRVKVPPCHPNAHL